VSTYLTKIIDARPTTAIKALMVALFIMAAALSAQPVVAKGTPDSFADLVETLSPAVVNISTIQKFKRNDRRRGRTDRRPDNQRRGGSENSPFGDFWERFGDRFEEEEENRTARSLGSGFIIDASGIIVTNNHVIADADEITVTLNNEDEYQAEVIGRDVLSDVAVLRLKSDTALNLPTVKFGNSEKQRIGDWVIAIGSPFGLESTVTAGIISGRNRDVRTGSLQPDVEFIQTDATINPGNSGGPMFNLEGQVIGVNTAIISPTGASVGIGFAIPSNDVQRVVGELMEHGKVRRGFLGVTLGNMTKDLAESMGIDFIKGTIVGTVNPDSPAERAGIEIGDIIIVWDGKKVVSSNSLSRLVKRTKVGQPVDVVVIRKGERTTLSVTTGEFVSPQTDDDDEDGEDDDNERDNGEDRLAFVEGMALSPINDRLRRTFRIAENVEGVVITRIAPRTPARVRLRPGMVIVRVNQQPVSTPSDVVEIIEAARDQGRRQVLLLIAQGRDGGTAHVPLRLLRERDNDD